MIKNFIFDFGNVLVHFDPEYLTSIYVKEEQDRQLVSQVLFDRLYWDRLDAGTISDEEVKQAACKRLPEHLHETACLVYDNWVMNLEQIDGMAQVVADLQAKGAGLYLLSNISQKFAAEHTLAPKVKSILSYFDGLVFSAMVGMIKPNADIFCYLLEKYGLKAEETMFIDDSARNIEGAEKVGIKGYLFDGDAKRLKEALEEQ